MKEPEFWSNFWPAFVSSIISGLIFTLLIGFLITYLRRPKIKICLSIGTNVKGHSLMFYAVNTGKIGLMPNEMQWNVYFPYRIEPRESFKQRCDSVIFNNEFYHNVLGFNEKSILPGDSLLLVYIPVNTREYNMDESSQEIPEEVVEQFKKSVGDFKFIDEAKYYYSLSTTRGQKKYVKFFWDYFKKKNYIEDGSFIKRPIFEVTEKVL